MTDREEELEAALEDMVWQFAYTGMKNGKAVLTTGGLSALKSAFQTLGWDDPHPIPQSLLCEWEDGCGKRSTCGTPTANGYRRCCGDHYAKYQQQERKPQ